jgi:roadblock/LC7 domain-containing protein
VQLMAKTLDDLMKIKGVAACGHGNQQEETKR